VACGTDAVAVQLSADVTVGFVATPTALFPSSITCEELHQRFLGDPDLTSVVIEGPLLVNRRPFYEALTGRLGYGRMLHFRRRVCKVVAPDPLLLDANESLERAAIRLLERGTGAAGDDVLVRLDIGWGIVPTARLHSHVATRHQERAEMISASEARFRALVERAVDVILVLDADHRAVYQSRPLDGASSLSQDADALSIVNPDDRADLEVALQRAARNPDATLRGEFRILGADGPPRLLEYSAQSFLHDPSVGGIVVNARDITERRALEDQLRHQAFHDPLTQLPNRELFFQRADYALQRLTRAAGIVSVLYIDLDGFKEINDELGHAVGDTVLMTVADRLREGLRRGDTLARLGGDEFAVLADGCEEREVVELGNRLLALVTEPISVDDQVVRVSASAGLATTFATIGVTALLQRADSAMYGAKEAGKNRLERFDPSRHERRLRHRRLTVDLPLAIRRHELDVLYQPIVDAHTLGITAVEALVRWDHPELGQIPPPVFIGLAEETGEIARIGSWVLEQACMHFAAWAATGPRPRYVSVNVSAIQLDDPTFPLAVRDVLRRRHLDADQLQLEVTESGMATDRPQRAIALTELQELGVRVAIDDFGTGYSSLSYLSQLPFDAIKLDRSFIIDVDRNPDATLLLERVVELVHSLGRRVTAEGVETDEHRRVLRDAGCDDLQGFLFARPESRDAIALRLRQPWPPRRSVVDDDVVSA
jgi:diguanylate cyclase (GGDEF)-like protein/PAS domain S-box-containing protein